MADAKFKELFYSLIGEMFMCEFEDCYYIIQRHIEEAGDFTIPDKRKAKNVEDIIFQNLDKLKIPCPDHIVECRDDTNDTTWCYKEEW